MTGYVDKLFNKGKCNQPSDKTVAYTQVYSYKKLITSLTSIKSNNRQLCQNAVFYFYIVEKMYIFFLNIYLSEIELSGTATEDAHLRHPVSLHLPSFTTYFL